jgi:hypothetical protein
MTPELTELATGLSISQFHVQPIVRGKIPADTEFGAKISVSLVEVMLFE